MTKVGGKILVNWKKIIGKKWLKYFQKNYNDKPNIIANRISKWILNKIAKNIHGKLLKGFMKNCWELRIESGKEMAREFLIRLLKEFSNKCQKYYESIGRRTYEKLPRIANKIAKVLVQEFHVDF